MTRVPLVVLAIAWAVPGAGHWLLGQRWRPVAYFVLLAGTFAAGLALTDGWAVELQDIQVRRGWASFLASTAQAFAGLPYLAGIAIDAARDFLPKPPNEVVAWLDLGRLFTMLAGLLNLLVALDAFERAVLARTGGRPAGAPP